MTQLRLREYQKEAIDAVFAAWAGGMQRPAIVLPTGAGKTVVFSALVKEFRAWSESPWEASKRVMILAHRDELVDQAIAKLRAVMPGVSIGKVKADDNDIYADVMVASVQTVQRKRLQALVHAQDNAGSIGLIITDECHHAAAASYKKIYAAFPDALQLGVTATMARGDRVGLGDVWDDVVYKRSILWMISKRYLTDVRTKQIDLKALDMSQVKRTFSTLSNGGGDWQAGALGEALMEAEFDTAIARAYREHAGDRQGIVFTPTVETAYAAEQALHDAGIMSYAVDGTTTCEARRDAYEAFRKGDIQVLVNCMVLTEGFDMPQAEVAVIARPTQSAPLYTQMIGRVLRPYPGKKEALVLDLVGASANKLRTLIDLEPEAVKTLRDGESLAEAVIREEEELNSTVSAGSLAFELKVREVNSFEASEHAWVRTPAGVLFINCGQTRVFLWPTPASWGGNRRGEWDVCVAVPGFPWKRIEPYTGLDIAAAMAWGEAVSEDYAPHFGTRRGAAWRKKKPTDAQKTKAAQYGISVAGKSAGQVSEAIDVAAGAEYFDEYVKG